MTKMQYDFASGSALVAPPKSGNKALVVGFIMAVACAGFLVAKPAVSSMQTLPSLDKGSVNHVMASTIRTTKSGWRTVSTSRAPGPKTLQARRTIKRATRGVTNEAKSWVSWTERFMSLPALLVIGVFVFVAGCLGFAAANDSTGNHH